MSMENGFDLDFPNEPDAASIDEMPRVIKNIENMELTLDHYAHPFVPEELRGTGPRGFNPTTTALEKGPGVSHRLMFITETDSGSYTETIRLTRPELVQAWLEIARFVTHELD